MVSYVIYRETWLHDLGGIAVSYLSEILVKQLGGGYTTECILRMRFVNRFIVKLYCHVTFCSSCLILIVANDIIHLKRKTISWRWGVDYVTKA